MAEISASNYIATIQSLDDFKKYLEKWYSQILEIRLKDLGKIVIENLENKVKRGEFLTLEELRAVIEMLEYKQPLRKSHLEKIRSILNRDISNKKNICEYGILNPMDQINRARKVKDPLVKVKYYIRAELLLEFLISVRPVEKEFDEGKISYEERLNKVNNLWNKIMKYWFSEV